MTRLETRMSSPSRFLGRHFDVSDSDNDNYVSVRGHKNVLRQLDGSEERVEIAARKSRWTAE